MVSIFKKRQRRSTKNVVVEDISNELLPIVGQRAFAVLMHNVLSSDECQQLIRRAENVGFDEALINNNGKQVLNKNIRACQRCMIDDKAISDDFFNRILSALKGTDLENKVLHAPWITSGDDHTITAVGLNERLRFLKYEPGHFFSAHRDLRFVRGADAGERTGETSHITVQLYLNDKFKGGTTRFISGKRHYDVKPRMGSILIFDHDLLHEGSKVTGGMKYSVRSDIMFTSRGAPQDLHKAFNMSTTI